MQPITHRVRGFLRQQGAALSPWSGLDATHSDCVIEDAEVLASTIDDSELTAQAKASLCVCMTSLSQSWRDGLTTLFERGNADQIATALEEMLLCCSRGRANGTFSESALLDGSLCDDGGGAGGVVYKGVSFPS